MQSQSIAAAALFAAALFSTMPAMAQKSAAGDAKQAPAGRELQVTEPKLAAFIDAVVKVERIGAAWKPKVAAAHDKGEADKLVQTAHKEMRQAVEAAPGISLEEYAAIAMAAQKDPELAAEVKSRLEAARGK